MVVPPSLKVLKKRVGVVSGHDGDGLPAGLVDLADRLMMLREARQKRSPRLVVGLSLRCALPLAAIPVDCQAQRLPLAEQQ